MESVKKGTAHLLAQRLTCRMVTEEDADYDAARSVRNGRVSKRPFVIVYAASAADVAEAVRFARAEKIRLSIRGAGHQVNGACVADAGIAIDISGLKGLTIDADALTATAGAGLTTGEFIRPLIDKGFIVTTGSHDSVGLSGITLSGGMGILMGKYGMVCDNLLSAEIVTADGQIRTASPTENPDLFWAIRGGGGNFGAVTALTFRIYPVEPTIAGMVMHPIERARDVLRFYRDYTRDLPDEMNAFFVLMTAPQGFPVCGIMACYTGPSLEQGETLVVPLREFGPPVMQMLGPASYLSLLDALQDHDPAGNYYANSLQCLPELTDDILDSIAAHGSALTAPGSAVVLYHHHGKSARTAPDATAFTPRSIPYFLGVYANWPPGDAAPHRRWLENLIAAVEPHAAQGGYVGLSDDCDNEGVRAIYQSNYARLAHIKAAYDPENLFCHNHNIPPHQEK